jgi:hypothetical protein
MAPDNARRRGSGSIWEPGTSTPRSNLDWGPSWGWGHVSPPVAASVLERLDPIEKFAKLFYLGLAVLIVFFATSVAAKSSQGAWQAVGDFLRAAGGSFLVAIAAAAVGCLVGFLFGIPRSLQRGPQIVPMQPPRQENETQSGGQEPNEPRKSTRPAQTSTSTGNEVAGRGPFLTNTSLEEISDWLTKIIIGLGLVQFRTLTEWLNTAAQQAASFIAPAADKTESPFFFALIITSLFSACFLTYLETRTRLTLLFVGAIQATGTDQHEPGKAQ